MATYALSARPPAGISDLGHARAPEHQAICLSKVYLTPAFFIPIVIDLRQPACQRAFRISHCGINFPLMGFGLDILIGLKEYGRRRADGTRFKFWWFALDRLPLLAPTVLRCAYQDYRRVVGLSARQRQSECGSGSVQGQHSWKTPGSLPVFALPRCSNEAERYAKEALPRRYCSHHIGCSHAETQFAVRGRPVVNCGSGWRTRSGTFFLQRRWCR